MEIAIQILVVLLPLIVIGLVVYRMRRFVRMVQDPEQLATLLSSQVRDALREAGFDPTKISLEELETNEELKQMVSGELRAAILRNLLRPHAAGAERTSAHSMSSMGFPTQPRGPEGLDLPTPIDGRRSTGGAGRWMLAILIVGAATAFALLWR